jgi:AraC family transcriptional regulator of adaptative response/methylated-DNA-[protein]-cysteine methyltransferase
MENSGDYARVERAITYLADHWQEQPSLDDVAAHVGRSTFHFQRLFQRWVGVSPKRFLQFVTLEHAKQRLRESATVLEAAFDVGLSGPSRLHDLFVGLEAVTPGQFRSAGKELRIEWGVHDSPFGRCFIAATSRGICALRFQQTGDDLVAMLRGDWQAAVLHRDQKSTALWIQRAFAPHADGDRLSLFVNGTPFQVQVWRALLAIPAGCLTTYQGIARAIGRPAASRAVGNAVGSNPIAWLIPCHRVIRGAGTLGGYRWGVTRKQAMLGWEACRD